MLVDPQFGSGGFIDSILALAAGDGPVQPERIGHGMYLAGHWNVADMVIGGTRQRWKEEVSERLDIQKCGVCDTPEQAMKHLALEDRPEPFFVSFVRIRRADQPLEGGWRWHKWGDYIGTRNPQREYLHDEPEIEEVYTFSVHEMPADAAIAE